MIFYNYTQAQKTDKLFVNHAANVADMQQPVSQNDNDDSADVKS